MKRFLAAVLAVAMLLSLAACGSSSSDDDTTETTDTTEETTETTESTETEEEAEDETEAEETSSDESEPVYGGTLTIQFDSFNTVFDPAMGEAYCYDLWYESLWCMDWSLDDPDTYDFSENVYTMDYAQGQIAESWEWDAEAMTLTVTIRDDIYFQDKTSVGMDEYDIYGGRNLTAEDVKYSYDRVTGLGSGFDEDTLVYIDSDWASKLSMLDYIEVTDTYTLVFYLNTDSETKLSDLITCDIDIIGPEWDELTDDQKSDWHYACGTGPYILTDFVADNHYTFVRNDNYYDYDERYPENQLPYLDGIVLQSYSDTTSAISAFIAGDLDYINSDTDLSDSERSQIIDNVLDCDVQTFTSYAEAMNLKITFEPFDSLEVRQAMQLAINLEEVATAYYGYDELTLADLWSSALSDFSTEWSDELIAEYTYDPEAAIALLEEAGYADGFEFTVAVSGMGNLEVFQLAKSYLAEVGITMNIETLSDMLELMTLQSDEDDERAYNDWIGNVTSVADFYQSYKADRFDWGNYFDGTEIYDLVDTLYNAASMEEQNEAAIVVNEYFLTQHWTIALSGRTEAYAYVSSELGGLENGELLNAGMFMGTITARIWNTTGE